MLYQQTDRLHFRFKLTDTPIIWAFVNVIWNHKNKGYQCVWVSVCLFSYKRWLFLFSFIHLCDFNIIVYLKVIVPVMYFPRRNLWEQNTHTQMKNNTFTFHMTHNLTYIGSPIILRLCFLTDLRKMSWRENRGRHTDYFCGSFNHIWKL